MFRIRPFRGVRPAPGRAAEIACVPYDVVSRAEAAALARDNPWSLLHIDRAEIDLPAATDPYADAVYRQAADRFATFRHAGALIQDPAPCLYLYRLQMGAHRQTGIAAVCHVDDYAAGIIRRHENTRPDKEEDRARLIDALDAQTGPVLLGYRGQPAIDALVERATQAEPLYDFVAPDGIGHTAWRVTDPAPLAAAFADVPLAYVADGHHRTAAATKVARARRERGDTRDSCNWFLAVLFPAAQLQILPYHRCVTDLNGLHPGDFLATLGRSFAVTPDADPAPPGPRQFSLYLAGRWYGLRATTPEPPDPVARLDVSLLQDLVLEPLLGIADPRTSHRIEFVGGSRGTAALAAAVDSGRMAAAFALHATAMESLLAVADAGHLMPPKSTWFEPKLRSGLFIHAF